MKGEGELFVDVFHGKYKKNISCGKINRKALKHMFTKASVSDATAV